MSCNDRPASSVDYSLYFLEGILCGPTGALVRKLRFIASYMYYTPSAYCCKKFPECYSHVSHLFAIYTVFPQFTVT